MLMIKDANLVVQLTHEIGTKGSINGMKCCVTRSFCPDYVWCLPLGGATEVWQFNKGIYT